MEQNYDSMKFISLASACKFSSRDNFLYNGYVYRTLFLIFVLWLVLYVWALCINDVILLLYQNNEPTLVLGLGRMKKYYLHTLCRVRLYTCTKKNVGIFLCVFSKEKHLVGLQLAKTFSTNVLSRYPESAHF